MEWISHTTTGFFLGQLMLKEEERPKYAGWWWALASISPDWLEFLTRWFGDIHRGVTHSVYVWPFLALAWAAVARKWGRQETGEIAGLAKMWAVFFVVVGSHMLLDVFMSYRWYLAWPFSHVTWAWGIMPFYDVYIFAGWLGLWYLNRKLKLSSATTAKIGLAILFFVFSVRGVGKIRAHSIIANGSLIAGSAGVRTRPTYYQPWIWFARDGSSEGDWKPLNVVTGEILQDYTRGGGFPPLPGQELVKLPGK